MENTYKVHLKCLFLNGEDLVACQKKLFAFDSRMHKKTSFYFDTLKVWRPNEKRTFIQKLKKVPIKPSNWLLGSWRFAGVNGCNNYPEFQAELGSFFGGLSDVKWQNLSIWMSVDQVYETRWDCLCAPRGARLSYAVEPMV